VSASWHLITGEYPPQSGGVSDYTATLARALLRAGREVHVWTNSRGDGEGSGVIVHRLPALFGEPALRALDAGLDGSSAPRVVLIQYVPQAFGMQGMNVGFCRWVRRRGAASGDDVRIMFHEPYYPFVVWPLHHNLLAMANRIMAGLVMSTARRAYVSTTAWAQRLRRYAPSSLQFVWLPIPSAIPALNDTELVVAAKRRLVPDPGSHLVGHFGTYGALNRLLLSPTLVLLLRSRPDVRICLLGSGSDAMASELQSRQPESRGRVIGLGHQAPAELAAGLQACDVALQPYPDGARDRKSTRLNSSHP
jgi:glycosyltransferase involved in cell wall biosynthesis